jgi:hypothetical protein
VRELAPAGTSQLVFVPLIGFRPEGTRVLRERTETTANGTRLIVLAAAAAPDRTDVVIEWERSGDPATCPPDSTLLTHTNMAPLEKGLTAGLVLGASQLSAITMRRRSMHVSHPTIGAVDAVTFPPLTTATDTAELRLSEGAQEWRVSLDLAAGGVEATALTEELTRDGVVMRATAAARHEGELIVELEIEATRQIRVVGWPIPTPARFASTSDEDQRARTLEHRRVFGEKSAQIALEYEGGGRYEEVRRLFSYDPQQTAPGRPYVSRFVVFFDAPRADAGSATIVVPFVELNDLEPSATADLRDVPIDVDLGEHHFRIISAEPSGTEQRTVVVEVAPSASSPRFTQPARMYGVDKTNFAWNPDPKPGDPVPYSTKIGDPPIVRFEGAVLRVDGPLRLEIPLA